MKWFSREKGWGFIRLASGEEVFVHHSDIEGEGFVSLEDDQTVEFVVEEMEKGPRARQVREVGAAAPGEADAAPTREADAAPTRESETRRGRRGERRAEASGARQGATAREDASGADESADRSEGRPPLAEQIRRRLGSLFPGLDG